jgi:hypothetical protein
MAFEKGRAKTGGRTKQSSVIKDMVRNFAIDKFDDFIEAFGKLGNKDKVDAYIKMLKYVLPTITAVQFDEQESTSPAMDLLRESQKKKK